MSYFHRKLTIVPMCNFQNLCLTVQVTLYAMLNSQVSSPYTSEEIEALLKMKLWEFYWRVWLWNCGCSCMHIHMYWIMFEIHRSMSIAVCSVGNLNASYLWLIVYSKKKVLYWLVSVIVVMLLQGVTFT